MTLVILLFSSILGAGASSISDREKSMIAVINKDPRSEVRRVSYIHYLLNEDRYDDAEKQLAALKVLNPRHQSIPLFESIISRFRSAKTEDEKLKVESEFAAMQMAELDRAFSELKDVSSQLSEPFGNSSRAVGDNRKEELKRKYDTHKMAQQLRESAKNVDFKCQLAVTTYSSANEFKLAIDQAKKCFDREQNTAPAYTSYAHTLGEGKKYEEALQVVRLGLKKFPEHLKLQLMNEKLTEVVSQQSTEKRQQKWLDYLLDSIAFDSIALDVSQSTLAK